jgi:hypothetical protein
LRTGTAAAQTGEKIGETTGETGETTAGTVAAEPIRRKAPRQTGKRQTLVAVVLDRTRRVEPA